MKSEPPPVDSSSAPSALRRLIGFRYAVAVLVAASVLSLHFIFDTLIPWTPVIAGFAALVLVDVALHWYVSARGTVGEKALLANFVLEIAALTSILYFVGGSTSPLVSLYLLPLTMAANLLTRRRDGAAVADAQRVVGRHAFGRPASARSCALTPSGATPRRMPWRMRSE